MIHFKDLPEDVQQQFGEECCNIHSLRKVKIKPNLREWMMDRYCNYDEDTESFVKKYTGKTVYVYCLYGDWFILGDDNFIIGWDCFDIKDGEV